MAIALTVKQLISELKTAEDQNALVTAYCSKFEYAVTSVSVNDNYVTLNDGSSDSPLTIGELLTNLETFNPEHHVHFCAQEAAEYGEEAKEMMKVTSVPNGSNDGPILFLDGYDGEDDE